MKVLKKVLLTGFLFFSSILEASWWGELEGEERTAIIIGTALILNNSYQNSEIKHKEYEIEKKIKEAHKKYSNKDEIEKEYFIENKIYNEEIKKLNNYNTEENFSSGKIIYSDKKSVLVELNDGTRIMFKKKDLKK